MSTFVLDRKFELQLPNSYVEIDRDEMEYIDGGITWKNARTIVYSALGFFIGSIVKKAVSASLIGLALEGASFWLMGVIDTAICAVIANPSLAIVSVALIGGAGYTVYEIGKKKKYW